MTPLTHDAPHTRDERKSGGLLDRLHRRLTEAYDEMFDNFVDPREPYYDVDGSPWIDVSGAATDEAAINSAYNNEQQLRNIQAECRRLAISNEFAINGHENRISYVVGTGHTYRAAVKKGHAAPETLAAAVQEVLDRFTAENHWTNRQQEIVRRRDRDGEVFLRFFDAADGSTAVRFVEPGQVATPVDRRDDPSAAFGIQTEEDDVETVLAYYIDGRPVDASQIQHRKAQVDSNVRRGLPLFYPVRKNLRRAEKLLKNMSVVAEIQSAIALIRRHSGGTSSSVQKFVDSTADLTTTNPATGDTRRFRRYAPGTILDAPAGLEYEFPAAGIDAANFVIVLQAELRAVASRLVMPEFMLTSDASNANYASTLVAEGPAVKMFERLQREMIDDDLVVMWRVVGNAVAAGVVPEEALAAVHIHVEPPTLTVRDRREEAEVHRIQHESGILSAQTWSQQSGLDYDQEQENIRMHRTAAGDAPPVD